MKPSTAIAAAFGLTAITAHAASVTLLPNDIHGGDTNTVSFSNADVTLTPLVGGAATTFNANAARVGADPVGTSNANGFSDPDTIVGNGNDETLQIDFQPTVGLTGLSWDFSRANNEGIRITGFTSDPGASIAGPGTGGGVSYSAGTLSFNLTLAAFTGTDGTLTLSNGAASAGQTLTILVNDSGEAGALFPITSFTYDNSVPEPSVALLGGLGLIGLLRRRR